MSEELRIYFKNMFSNIDNNIILDDSQIEAILNEDKYTLILAGAGTGKTTTMVGKVKYLVDIKKVDPSRILVISYTKKAVEELQTLIIDEFNLNVNVTTFHSLAYKYIRNIFNNRKCKVVDYNEKEEIFYDFINDMFKNKRIKDLITTFTKDKIKLEHFFYGFFFEQNYEKFKDYDTFFLKYKEYKIQEAQNIGLKKVIHEWIDKKLNSDTIITIKGELVKSVGEAVIANFLYTHGIDYKYEEVYSEIVEDRKIYKPDFTLDLAGSKVYLEYFGMNDSKYNKITTKKIEFHKKYQNKFIYLEQMSKKEIEKRLDFELKKLGFLYREKTDLEIYNQILDINKLSQIFKLKKLFYETINQIKESPNREDYMNIVKKYIDTLDDNEKQEAIKQFNYINEFYSYYSKRVFGADTYGFDYSDLIHFSNKYILEMPFINDMAYDYIIIDEYQDISHSEYTLARKTSNRNNSKVFAVGDDWQSIYSYRGAKIDYITKFNTYFENPKILSINKNYRHGQELTNISGNFIKENKCQINKNLISYKHLEHPIHFISYDDRVVNETNKYEIDESIEYKVLKDTILNIHKEKPEHSILILARNNDMIEKCFKYDKDFIDDLGTKIRISSINDLNLDGMTIHKSKGLTYDEVILIGMNNQFPKDSFTNYWLIDLFKPPVPIEGIEYPEERRIFYVALTRTKNNVYILKNENPRHRSKFIDEIIKKCQEEENK